MYLPASDSMSVFGDLPGHVAHGAPAGQHFGVGGAWQRAGPGARPAWAGFSKAAVCGAGAPCTPVWKSTSELGYGNNVASMAWGVRNLIPTQVHADDGEGG